jgi:hypothetical protein
MSMTTTLYYGVEGLHESIDSTNLGRTRAAAARFTQRPISGR